MILLAGCTVMPRAARGRGQATTADQQAMADARANVQGLIRESGAQAAVAFRSLDGGREVFINADEQFPATSQWVEIPVTIELYAEAQAKALRLDDTLLVHNEFRSVDGDMYQLAPGLDPDPQLYRAIGQRVSLGDLDERMMKQNSQLAANLLIEHLGLNEINARLAELHASGIKIEHAFQDPAERKSGKRNTASARSMMQILWLLATNGAISADASKEIVGVIANARTATAGPFAANPESLAPGNVYQEALIVYGARPFALSVVVHGLKSGGASAALMARISHALAARD